MALQTSSCAPRRPAPIPQTWSSLRWCAFFFDVPPLYYDPSSFLPVRRAMILNAPGLVLALRWPVVPRTDSCPPVPGLLGKQFQRLSLISLGTFGAPQPHRLFPSFLSSRFFTIGDGPRTPPPVRYFFFYGFPFLAIVSRWGKSISGGRPGVVATRLPPLGQSFFAPPLSSGVLDGDARRQLRVGTTTERIFCMCCVLAGAPGK